tara:strand:+ start:1114 stop:1338 length:225 start_codon:yes stop_codon:yes gene_type:complete
MSRDNVIAVAKYKYKYYVLANLNMENQFNIDYIKQMLDSKNCKFTRNRGKALIIGHNIQKKIDTEYGVNEINIY